MLRLLDSVGCSTRLGLAWPWCWSGANDVHEVSPFTNSLKVMRKSFVRVIYYVLVKWNKFGVWTTDLLGDCGGTFRVECMQCVIVEISFY